jgi:thiol-disulfide isomerase/thioredoxin
MRKRLTLLLFFSGLVISLHAQEVRAIKATELEKMISESKGPLIINMWATWCKPCIEEIPYFLEEVKQYNGAGKPDTIRLLLVSLDFKENFPAGISSFANKRKYDVPLAWLDETNADYFCPKLDPRWSGAIPATLFVNNKTGHRKFAEEQLSHEQLKEEIRSLTQ